MSYSQPLGANTIVTGALLHPKNECQQSINTLCSGEVANQGIAWIFDHIMKLLPTLISKKTTHQMKNMDSKLIDIATCKTPKNILLVVDYVISIRCYYQTAKTTALYESIDGSAGQPTDNPPNSDRLPNYHRTVPELTVQLYS